MGSNFVAISFGLFILGLLLYVALVDERMLTIAVFGFTMMVPLGSMFSASKTRNGLLIYTITMAVAGLVAIGLTFVTAEMFNFLSVIYIIGIVAFQWVANFLLIKENNQ